MVEHSLGKGECNPGGIRTYKKGVKVSDAEMASLNITGDDFDPEWNYTINPR
jgi:hypothetical protein